MNLAAQYARALFALIEEKPTQGALFLRNLSSVLQRQGHEKLFPRVFAEYRKLLVQQERARNRAHVTAEQERTRVLLELYRTLIKV